MASMTPRPPLAPASSHASLAPRLRRAPWLLAAPLALAACGAPKQDAFAPPCPKPVILGDAGDLARYRNNGRDPTDLELQARIAGISGTCEEGEKDKTKVTVNVAMAVARGPALRGRQADLAWFLAVTRNGQILDKSTYPVSVAFPSNAARVEVDPNPVVLQLPTPKGTTASDYQVVVGYQLSPDELARNREQVSHN
jgi:hypothetical protein